MNIEIGDVFVLRLNPNIYRVKVINISYYRPPETKYGCDVYVNGVYSGDVSFVGDEFFNRYKENLERIKEY